jgi:long-chain fatty acid transport protein
MTTKSLLVALSAGAALGAVAAPAYAAGFYVQEQSVRGVGRAFSGEAADSGVASLWWNPASIGQMPDRGEAYVGFNYINVHADVNDAGSTIQRVPAGLPRLPVGGGAAQRNPIDDGYLPNLGAAWKLNDRLAFGVSVNAPFNFVTRYPLNSWTRYQALKSDLFNIDIQPTLAWTPAPQITLAAGFDASYARATLSNALPNLSPLLPDAGQVLTGKGWDYGWVIGGQWRPVERVTLGASYRSGIRHDLDGTATIVGLLGPAAAANVAGPASATFRAPSIATFSGRFKGNDRLTLDVQLQRFGWSAFDAINVSAGGRTQAIPQSYRDTTTLAVGVDYAVSPRLTLRSGVQRDPTPTPENGRTARVPDSDRWLFAAGATFRPVQRVAVDLGASYIDFDDSRINSNATAFAGTPLQTPILMAGTVGGYGLVFSAGVRLGL